MRQSAKAQSPRLRQRAHALNVCTCCSLGKFQIAMRGGLSCKFTRATIRRGRSLPSRLTRRRRRRSARPPPSRRALLRRSRHTNCMEIAQATLYGEADAGRIWHRAAKQLIEVQGFTQSEFDPCYFFKKYDDDHRVDLVLYVDSQLLDGRHGQLEGGRGPAHFLRAI
eukprot:4427075-Pleurochrysis_carterae.AAC.2